MQAMGLSISAFHRILKKTGAERVSDDAAEELRDTMQQIASDLAKDVVTAAKHAGRKTVLKEDIEFVMRE